MQFLEEGGSSLQLAPSLGGRWYPNPKPLDANLRPQVWSDRMLLLASGDSAFLAVRKTLGFHQIYLFATTDKAFLTQTVEFNLDLPGYLQSRVSLEATPLDRNLAPSTIFLRRSAIGSGSVEVEFKDWSPENVASQGPGLLYLTDLDSNAEMFAPLDPSPRMTCTIDGIPAGRYVAEFELAGFNERFPVAGTGGVPSLDVSSGRVSTVVIHRPALGELLVEVLDAKDAAFDRHVALSVFGEGLAAEYSFPGAPYRIRAIPAGQYEIRM